jgi:hypothetical protein
MALDVKVTFRLTGVRLCAYCLANHHVQHPPNPEKPYGHQDHCGCWCGGGGRKESAFGISVIPSGIVTRYFCKDCLSGHFAPAPRDPAGPCPRRNCECWCNEPPVTVSGRSPQS